MEAWWNQPQSFPTAQGIFGKILLRFCWRYGQDDWESPGRKTTADPDVKLLLWLWRNYSSPKILQCKVWNLLWTAECKFSMSHEKFCLWRCASGKDFSMCIAQCGKSCIFSFFGQSRILQYIIMTTKALIRLQRMGDWSEPILTSYALR